MSPALLKQATAYFREHEGVVPWMYLCIHGKVTAGVGHMFSTPASARAAGWQRANVLVSYAEIDQAWNRVKAAPFGIKHPAKFYEPLTTIRLSPQAVDGLLHADLVSFERALSDMLPHWDRYPNSAQLGLLDMAFALGPTGFRTGYPKCFAAARAGDWATCANECQRKGVSESRNKAVRDLFLNSKKGF